MGGGKCMSDVVVFLVSLWGGIGGQMESDMVKMGWSKWRGEVKLVLVWLVKIDSYVVVLLMEMQVVWRSDVVCDSGEQLLEGSLGGGVQGFIMSRGWFIVGYGYGIFYGCLEI